MLVDEEEQQHKVVSVIGCIEDRIMLLVDETDLRGESLLNSDEHFARNEHYDFIFLYDLLGC